MKETYKVISALHYTYIGGVLVQHELNKPSFQSCREFENWLFQQTSVDFEPRIKGCYGIQRLTNCLEVTRDGVKTTHYLDIFYKVI